MRSKVMRFKVMRSEVMRSKVMRSKVMRSKPEVTSQTSSLQYGLLTPIQPTVSLSIINRDNCYSRCVGVRNFDF